CDLTFVGTDDVDTIGEIPVAPFRSVGAADKHKLHAVGFGDFGETQDVLTRDDVCIETDDARPQTAYGVFEIREVPECSIENFHAEARSLEISRKIEDSERRIGLHHALLDEVVLQKIGMTQQNVCHFRNPMGAGTSV